MSLAGQSEGGHNLVWVDRQGAVEPVARHCQAVFMATPVCHLMGSGWLVTIPPDIWVYDLSRPTLTRLTFEGETRYCSGRRMDNT